MVGIHVIGHRRQGCVGRVCLVGREHGDGLVSQPDVFEQGIAVLVILAQQMAALVVDKQLRRCGSRVHFAYALTCVIVGVIGGAAGECNARQSAPRKSQLWYVRMQARLTFSFNFPIYDFAKLAQIIPPEDTTTLYPAQLRKSNSFHRTALD